jgi:hypothetical protein
MGGKGKAPPPVDPGKAMGEYLFGKDFGQYQGVTDPVLQERLIGAEEEFRPRYAALELQDIQTYAQGLKDPETGEVITPGVLDLLEEQSQRAGALQRELRSSPKGRVLCSVNSFNSNVNRMLHPFRSSHRRSWRLIVRLTLAVQH